MLCNYNIRSFNKNFDNFEGFLHSVSNEFNLIVLTETRFGAGQGRDIVGYSGYHTGRVGGGGGGVSVFSDHLLHTSHLSRLSFVNENIEACVVSVSTNTRKIVIVALYRPPNGRVDLFCGSLLTIMCDESVRQSEICLLYTSDAADE